MRINDDHMFHGAALTQIAEHPAFTAINAFSHNSERSRSGFRINDGIGIYIKYASAPKGRFHEYAFTFQQPHLEELKVLDEKCTNVFIVLVCIKEKEICVVPYGDLCKLISARREAFGADEDQYQVLVTAPKNKQFRVYVNTPGVKGAMLGERKVKRSAFPDTLFA